jgi:hypothetical protein
VDRTTKEASSNLLPQSLRNINSARSAASHSFSAITLNVSVTVALNFTSNTAMTAPIIGSTSLDHKGNQNSNASSLVMIFHFFGDGNRLTAKQHQAATHRKPLSE